MEKPRNIADEIVNAFWERMLGIHHPDNQRIAELEHENGLDIPFDIDPDTGHVFGCKCGYCLWKDETLNGQILPQPENE